MLLENKIIGFSIKKLGAFEKMYVFDEETKKLHCVCFSKKNYGFLCQKTLWTVTEGNQKGLTEANATNRRKDRSQISPIRFKISCGVCVFKSTPI